MGTVFKKRSFRTLPASAEIISKGGRRLARWAAKGKAKSAPVVITANGAERIVTESRTYFAKYRDGGGKVRLVATGCRDERAARMRLSELERTAERVRIGVATAAESSAGDCRRDPFAEHLDAYLTHLELDGACKEHRSTRKRQLNRLAAACGWRTLGDLDAGPLADWLICQVRDKMGARTRNTYLQRKTTDAR